MRETTKAKTQDVEIKRAGNRRGKSRKSREKPFNNYVPEGSLIVGEDQYFSRDCFKTQLNNNVMVVGTSGSGKTRSIVRPNLLQAQGSYVVSDPKGNLSKIFGPYFRAKGYRVYEFNFIHPEKSCRYNPIKYCRNTTDVRKLAHTLVYEMNRAGGSKGSNYDPFWDEASLMLLTAAIGYMLETDELYESEKNITTLSRLIREANRTCNGYARGHSEMDERMEKHRKRMKARKKTSWAADRYDEYNSSPDKTHQTINICALAKMSTFDTLETRLMTADNDLEFSNIGKEKSIVFVIVSDTDRSMDILVNLFYSQMMNELCTYADDQCEDSRLPVPVQFILDDFATNARIDNFQNIISNIRSRGISTMLMLQSEAQLRAGYGDDAQTIVDNCNTYVYMGGSNPQMAEIIAKRANKPASGILNMPLSTSWVFRRGQAPVLCHNFDLNRYEEAIGFVPGEPGDQSDPGKAEKPGRRGRPRKADTKTRGNNTGKPEIAIN